MPKKRHICPYKFLAQETHPTLKAQNVANQNENGNSEYNNTSSGNDIMTIIAKQWEEIIAQLLVSMENE